MLQVPPVNASPLVLWLWRRLLPLLLVLLAGGCASLPAEVPRTPSQALHNTADTPLGQTVRALTPAPAPGAGSPGSGVMALVEGVDAFAARLALASAATRSIDIQTYIWSNDATGKLLFDQMRQAADRGVRVRLLLDDNTTAGLDPMLALLASHPGIEVRLFNPFANRSLRLGDWLGRFERINRRMHNKTFVADNQMAIVGGRNIGNAYFAAGQELSFEDADVLVVGEVVPEISAAFDRFWNSPLAWPAMALLRPGQAADPASFEEEISRIHHSPQAAAYHQAMARSDLVQGLVRRQFPLEWTTVRLLGDDPASVLHAVEGTEGRMAPALGAVLSGAQTSLDLVSAYFVPGEDGAQALSALARRGVRVRVLTNSLAATDVAAAHAGYARQRETLLRAGVRLFELKPAYPTAPTTVPHRRPHLSGSQASLHAKTFAIDGRQLFVGSFNLDPRSARLNTEIGLLVDSPALAAQLATALDEVAPDYAYEVRLSPQGKLQWIAGPDPAPPLNVEPEAGPLRRLIVHILSRLSLDWML